VYHTPCVIEIVCHRISLLLPPLTLYFILSLDTDSQRPAFLQIKELSLALGSKIYVLWYNSVLRKEDEGPFQSACKSVLRLITVCLMNPNETNLRALDISLQLMAEKCRVACKGLMSDENMSKLETLLAYIMDRQFLASIMTRDDYMEERVRWRELLGQEEEEQGGGGGGGGGTQDGRESQVKTESPVSVEKKMEEGEGERNGGGKEKVIEKALEKAGGNKEEEKEEEEEKGNMPKLWLKALKPHLPPHTILFGKRLWRFVTEFIPQHGRTSIPSDIDESIKPLITLWRKSLKLDRDLLDHDLFSLGYYAMHIFSSYSHIMKESIFFKAISLKSSDKEAKADLQDKLLPPALLESLKFLRDSPIAVYAVMLGDTFISGFMDLTPVQLRERIAPSLGKWLCTIILRIEAPGRALAKALELLLQALLSPDNITYEDIDRVTELVTAGKQILKVFYENVNSVCYNHFVEYVTRLRGLDRESTSVELTQVFEACAAVFRNALITIRHLCTPATNLLGGGREISIAVAMCDRIEASLVDFPSVAECVEEVLGDGISEADFCRLYFTRILALGKAVIGLEGRVKGGKEEGVEKEEGKDEEKVSPPQEMKSNRGLASRWRKLCALSKSSLITSLCHYSSATPVPLPPPHSQAESGSLHLIKKLKRSIHSFLVTLLVHSAPEGKDVSKDLERFLFSAFSSLGLCVKYSSVNLSYLHHIFLKLMKHLPPSYKKGVTDELRTLLLDDFPTIYSIGRSTGLLSMLTVDGISSRLLHQLSGSVQYNANRSIKELLWAFQSLSEVSLTHLREELGEADLADALTCENAQQIYVSIQNELSDIYLCHLDMVETVLDPPIAQTILEKCVSGSVFSTSTDTFTCVEEDGQWTCQGLSGSNGCKAVLSASINDPPPSSPLPPVVLYGRRKFRGSDESIICATCLAQSLLPLTRAHAFTNLIRELSETLSSRFTDLCIAVSTHNSSGKLLVEFLFPLKYLGSLIRKEVSNVLMTEEKPKSRMSRILDLLKSRQEAMLEMTPLIYRSRVNTILKSLQPSCLSYFYLMAVFLYRPYLLFDVNNRSEVREEPEQEEEQEEQEQGEEEGERVTSSRQASSKNLKLLLLGLDSAGKVWGSDYWHPSSSPTSAPSSVPSSSPM
jgi:hypothetical protein